MSIAILPRTAGVRNALITIFAVFSLLVFGALAMRAVEAARAGDAGKGFAVVASEVKNLPNQTAKATDEIAQQVSGIQAETGNAVTAIRNIAKAIEQQSASTQEISRNVQQAAVGTQDVSSNVGGVTQSVNATRTAAETVTGQAQALRGDVESFLAKIRAA